MKKRGKREGKKKEARWRGREEEEGKVGGGGKEGRREKREREGEGEVCKVSLMSWELQVNYTNLINVKLQVQLCGGCYFYFFLM